MHTVLETCETKMKKSVVALTNEYGALRTGRASAALFDKIKVDYYGQETPLSQVASISIPEARLVVIQPWDKTLLAPIERAILKSELSLNPNNDGKLLRINFPPLTEERRKELAKNAKAIAEQSKIAIRNIRRDAIDEIKKLQKSGDISEDEQKDLETKTQNLTDSYVAQISDLATEKEKEILEI
ncbi:ribosome recycling factor [Pleomorphochaeta sp. DL1XJH-081]|jgi:ribosome recycling factor|uniref:ribosome recycling factor n=1 Tax=Pleomorphochaeta sp. DL1XJH-081 TaxID=3409690 RepID=UPI003BB715BE